jgi:hypothetical protein
MELFITSLFHLVFHRLVRVCHKLEFHSNNQKREGGDLCISDVKLGWLSMENFVLYLVFFGDPISAPAPPPQDLFLLVRVSVSAAHFPVTSIGAFSFLLDF